MKVLFDLRPKHLVQIQETRVDPMRLLTVLLFAVFVLLSSFNIGYMLYYMMNASAELSRMRNEEIIVLDNERRIAESLASSRAFRDSIRTYIDFMDQDIPTVEFLSALEGASPAGLKITTVEMRPGGVMMKGTSLTDQDIIDFGADLGGIRGVVTKVDAPITTHGRLGSRMISEFTITCGIGSLSDVAARYAADLGGSR